MEFEAKTDKLVNVSKANLTIQTKNKLQMHFLGNIKVHIKVLQWLIAKQYKTLSFTFGLKYLNHFFIQVNHEFNIAWKKSAVSTH